MWLRTVLANSDRKSVVITHRAPSLLSVAPALRHSGLAPARDSAPGEFVAGSGAVLYVLGSTPVVSNPSGYVDEPVEGFQPGPVVDV